MATGGYEFETCDKMGENFKCVICTWILRDPMALPCPHTFCRSCLTQWQETRNVIPYKCPTCNQTYEESQLHLNRSVDLMVRAKLDVFCKKHDIGCDWTGTIDDYDLHTNRDCTCADVQCQNTGCTVVILRKNKESHALNCPMRFIPCSFCDRMVIFSTIETHYKTCEMMNITCLNDGCIEKFTRKDFDRHQESCEFQIIDCVYKDIGCMVKLKKNEMDNHTKNLHEHFLLMHQEYRNMKAESISTCKQLNHTKQKLIDTEQKLIDTEQKLNDTKQKLNGIEQRMNESIKELYRNNERLNKDLNETNKKLSQLEISLLPPDERNVEICIEQLKSFEENVINHELLFKELLRLMQNEKRYIIKNNYYYKLEYNERWQKGYLFVYVVDGPFFDELKTHHWTVHHNNNVCVWVDDVVVHIYLLVEEGWTDDNTRCSIIHPKLHKKVDCRPVVKRDYCDCLVDGFILLQICRI